MSATIHYLPTAGIEPLPRRANAGLLPGGVAKFSAYRRRQVASAAPAPEPRVGFSDATLAQARKVAALLQETAHRCGIACTFEDALLSCMAALAGPSPRGAA